MHGIFLISFISISSSPSSYPPQPSPSQPSRSSPSPEDSSADPFRLVVTAAFIDLLLPFRRRTTGSRLSKQYLPTPSPFSRQHQFTCRHCTEKARKGSRYLTGSRLQHWRWSMHRWRSKLRTLPRDTHTHATRHRYPPRHANLVLLDISLSSSATRHPYPWRHDNDIKLW
eukprot:3201544-Rhodomonas_salina.1